jgi:hypothetical protein
MFLRLDKANFVQSASELIARGTGKEHSKLYEAAF